jgi:hypothetical protein
MVHRNYCEYHVNRVSDTYKRQTVKEVNVRKRESTRAVHINIYISTYPLHVRRSPSAIYAVYAICL